MRDKRKRATTSTRVRRGDPDGIDLGASARQIGLIETANGAPHGIAAIAVAFGAVLLLVPARAIWRAVTRRDRDRS